MKICTALFCILLTAISMQLQAISFAENGSAFQHLAAVNKQWQQCGIAAPFVPVNFCTENDRIQFHLLEAEQYLRSHASPQLSKDALQKRLQLLDVLHAYALREIFPVNSHHAERQPYFIDDRGVYCAVGYLLFVSGFDAIACEVHANQNYAYIKEISSAELYAWAETYGFTVDELALIQPTYPPSTPFVPLMEGTSGPVNLLYTDIYSGRIIFAGTFDSVNNAPCKNIGYYQDDALSCFNNGLNGILHDVIDLEGEVIAAGSIEYAGNIYPLAVFDGFSWSYRSIPGKDNIMGSAIFSGGLDHTLELCFTDAAAPGYTELWYQLNDGSWQPQMKVHGIIKDIASGSYGRIYAGSFDSATVYRSGMPDTLIMANNVLFKRNYEDIWFSAGAQVSDTVYAISNIGEAVYFGGSCSGAEGENPVCLSRYLFDDLQPVILHNAFSDSAAAIYAMQMYNTTDLLLAGRFKLSLDFGTYGNNIASYNLVANYTTGVGDLNDAVSGLAQWDDTWVIGGYFTGNNVSGEYLPYLSKIDYENAVQDFSATHAFRIYPNPANVSITLADAEIAGENLFAIVSDMAGAVLKTIPLTQIEQTIDISDLSAGMYMMTLQGKNTGSIEKFQIIH